MQHRIFHKILVSALAICIIAPFFVSNTFADTTGGNFSVTTRVEYIRGRTENGGSYDWTTNMITTVNFYMPFTGQFRLRTDGVNPIFVTGRADVDGAVLLSVGTNGLSVDFQAEECKSFTYTQTYDYKTGYSTNIYGSVLNGVYQNGTIIQYIDNVETELSNISTTIDGIEATLEDLQSTLLIDNILPESDTAYLLFRNLGSLQFYDRDRFPYYNISSNNHSSLKLYLFANRSYYFSARFYNPSEYSLWSYIKLLNNSGVNQTYNQSYHDYVGNYSTVTFSFVPESSGYYYLDFTDYLIGKSITPYYFGNGVNLSDEMLSITRIPDNSTRTSFIQQILNHLSNGSNQTNNIVNSNNSKNDQLNESVTQYDNLENQFKSDFSTSMTAINKPSLDNIVSAAAWYTTQLTALFNASGSFQIIYVLPLVLGIALFFIGRGGVVFRQSSISETEYVHTRYNDDGTATVEHGTYVSSGSRRKGRRF